MTLSRSQLGQGCYLLGTVIVSGNAGALAFGDEVFRTATLSFGLLILLSACVILSSMRKEQVHFATMACAPLLLIECIVRVHHETTLYENALAFRLVCYQYYIAGVLIAPSLRKTQSLHVALLIVTTVVACLLSLGYLLSLSGMQASAGRLTIDDSLNPVGIAYGFGVVVVTALGILLSARSKLATPVCSFAMILGLACVFFTGSRGAMVSLLITIGFYLMLRTRMPGRNHAYTPLATGLKLGCAVVVVILVVVSFREVLEPQFEFVENRFTGSSDTGYDSSMEGRAQLRSYYWDHINEWWLFGYERYDGAYPHNMFLEAWIRFGLFGFAVSGAIVAAICKLVSMARLLPDSVILSVTALQGLFTLANAQTSLCLEFQRTLWGACGMGLTLLLMARRKQAESSAYAKGAFGRAR